MSDVDVKEIISATIKELQSDENQIQFKKPTTIQGWFYVSLAFCSIVGAIFTSIVFINNVIEHATSKDLHRREEVLELKIANEIKPIREKQNIILTNQATIQSGQAHFRDDVKDIRDDVKRVQESINRLSDKISN